MSQNRKATLKKDSILIFILIGITIALAVAIPLVAVAPTNQGAGYIGDVFEKAIPLGEEEQSEQTPSKQNPLARTLFGILTVLIVVTMILCIMKLVRIMT